MDNNVIHSTMLVLSAATIMCSYIMLEQEEDDTEYTTEDVEMMVLRELKERTNKRRQYSGDTHGDNNATRKKDTSSTIDRERASML